MNKDVEKKILEFELELNRLGFKEDVIRSCIEKIENGIVDLLNKPEKLSNHFRLLNSKLSFIESEFLNRRRRRLLNALRNKKFVEEKIFWENKKELAKKKMNSICKNPHFLSALHKLFDESVKL